MDDTVEARAAQVSMQVSNSETARHIQLGRLNAKGELQNIDKLVTMFGAMK